MLVLTRKQTESIRISDTVVVTVLRIRGNRVRLGVEAPQGVPVHRTEVHEKVSQETELPAATTKRSAESGTLWQRVCPVCTALQPVREQVCGCGHVFAVTVGPSINEAD